MHDPMSPQLREAQVSDKPDENQALARDIVLLSNHDRAAFRRLYARTADRLFAICLRVTRDHSAAQDVLQEAYLKIWDRAGGFDPERNRPLAWLAAIARNSAIDWYRSQGRNKFVSDEMLISRPSEAMASDDRIIAMEREDRVWSAVADLDEQSESELKSIFLLGLTYPEAAERLKLPLATFKSRVRRTVLKMQKKIGDD